MTVHRAALAILFISFALPSAAQTTPEPTRLSDSAAQGLLIRRVNPAYPPLARQARIQGTIILSVTISGSGDVENVRVVSGHPMLAPAAIEAVKQWKYQPYLVDGAPVEVQTRVQVNFVLAAADAKPDAPDDFAASVQGGASADRVRVSEDVMRSFRIQEIDPAYPPLALRAKIEGLVVLKEFIGKSGDVEDLDLISGDPLLTPAAIDAVRQWKYRPYLLHGEPVEVETLVRVNFALSREKGQGSATDADLGAAPSEIVPTNEVKPDASDSPAPNRIRISSGVSGSLLLSKVSPEYPADARAQRIQGVVILKATIDPEGNVIDLELISGHPLLAPAAMDAVKQWKYKPYLLNGNAMTVETRIQVNFILSSN